MVTMMSSLLVFIGHSFFFCKVYVQIFAHFKKWVVFLLLSYEFFSYSGYNFMLKQKLQIFFSIFDLTPIFNDIFSVAKVFTF